jgi:pSer/pThr/pTyr-binding forkhead associated (FHA) protein
MNSRSLVIEIPADRAVDTPVVILPPGVRNPLDGAAAVVIEAGGGGFSLRAALPSTHVTPIEDQPLLQAGWRVRREAPRAGENTLAEGTQWGQPELRIFPRAGGPPQAVKLPMAEGASLIVGRSSKQAEIVIEDEYVSRRHARFVARNGGVFVEDLGSQWGVFVDDRRVNAPTPLRDGAKLLIGKTRIQFLHLLASLEALPAPPPGLSPAAPLDAAPAKPEPVRSARSLLAVPESAPAADRRRASRASLVPLATALLSLGAVAYYLALWLRAAP